MLPKIFPVTCHTNHIGHNSTFVAIKGFSQDGTQYVETAIQKGATTIILEESACLEKKHPHVDYIFVSDARKALAEYASASLQHPATKLKIIGITGTKGKTTTTFLIEHILKTAGFKTALLGTIKNKILDQEETSPLTSAPSDYLHMFFAECVQKGVQFVVMEVSSHSIALQRTYGILFDAIGFTNLALEHLDFHATMQDYFETKTNLFSQLKPAGTICINIDDTW